MRQLVEHDVVREAARLHAHEASDDEDEGHVQPDDAVRDRYSYIQGDIERHVQPDDAVRDR